MNSLRTPRDCPWEWMSDLLTPCERVLRPDSSKAVRRWVTLIPSFWARQRAKQESFPPLQDTNALLFIRLIIWSVHARRCSQNMITNNNRDAFLDIAKGLAIILVVVGHVIQGSSEKFDNLLWFRGMDSFPRLLTEQDYLNEISRLWQSLYRVCLDL